MKASKHDVRNDVHSGAAKSTAFSAILRKLVISTSGTVFLAALGLPFQIMTIPYLMMRSRFVKSETGETTLQFWTKFAILELFYGGFLLIFSSLVLLPLVGPKLTVYQALALYLPMYTITLHDRRLQYGSFGTFVLQNFFDTPLMIAGYISREFFGLRTFAPFANIMDDTIVQGSLPFPSDIAVLAAEPYNVGLIVNMCREYNGAIFEMKECGIEQCHLPHQDTTAPSYESLVEGYARIREFKRQNPSKRVYIHCKGGIARASTMTLAHYIYNEKKDPSIAIQTMKAKRHVVFTGVQYFPAIVKLNKERLLTQAQ